LNACDIGHKGTSVPVITEIKTDVGKSFNGGFFSRRGEQEGKEMECVVHATLFIPPTWVVGVAQG
jgi:hypothetical protein